MDLAVRQSNVKQNHVEGKPNTQPQNKLTYNLMVLRRTHQQQLKKTNQSLDYIYEIVVNLPKKKKMKMIFAIFYQAMH